MTFFRLKLSAAVVFSPLLTVISILKLLVASLYPFVCVPTLSLALNNSCKSMQAEQFFISSHDKFSLLIVLVAFPTCGVRFALLEQGPFSGEK